MTGCRRERDEPQCRGRHGAARGFGREIARRLLARGHQVVITDLNDDAVTVTAEELAHAGDAVTAIVADARVAAEHRRVAAAAAELGPVTVWVNNAGVLRSGRCGSSRRRTRR